MRFSATILATRLLLMVQLLACNWALEYSTSSGWTKLKISPEALCSMRYGNFRLKIYEHLINQKTTTVPVQKRYFYSPIAQLDHASAYVNYNNVTKLTKMRFRIEIWTDHVESEILNYLPQIVGHEIKPYQVEIIPFEKVFLASTNLEPLTAYSLPTNWLPYQLEKSLWFSLTCFNQEDCNHLKDNMHQDPVEFDNLKLLFSLSSQTSQTKETIIPYEHIVTTQLVSKLLKQCENTEYALITTEEAN